MQPALAFCLAQAVCCYLLLHAQALPIATDGSEQLVRDGLNSTGDYQLNNYIRMLSTLRKHFLEEGCNGTYNGHRVTPHFCEQTSIKTFEALQPLPDTQGCDIDFAFPISNLVEKAIGAELAIYKQIRTSSEHAYTVYIVHKVGGERSRILDTKTISWSRKGWQAFNIDTVATQWREPKAEFTVQVAVDFDGIFLSCQSVKSLFVLNKREDSRTVPDRFAPVVTAFSTTVGSFLYCKVFPTECGSLQPSVEPAALGPVLTDVERRHRRDISDYVLQIFFERRGWKEANCVNVSFNGHPVSPHHCNTRQTKTFSALEEVERSMYWYTCDLHFNISVGSSETMVGADMALYKLEEVNATESGSYNILIIHALTNVFNQLVSNVTIPATSTGWQVFHIDSAVTSLQAGHKELLLRILVSPNKNQYLSCSEISSLFVLNDAALRVNNAQLGSDQGSGIEQQPTEGTGIPDRQIYFPVITLFVTGSTLLQPRFKRSTADIQVDRPDSQQGTCEIQDHRVNLDGTISGATVIQPNSVNVRRCSGQCRAHADKRSFPTLSRVTQCEPTSYTSLDVLVQKEGVLVIDTLADIIVDNCSCV